jgi:uncharacterized caspase-like protein
MPRIRTIIAALVALVALVPLAFILRPSAAGAEKRVALVVGNAGYEVGALATPANDAGLIAQTLQAAGFDVVGARDLDQDSLRRALRDFLEKATNSGPDTVAFIYVSGYGLQLEGENYIVPIDAKIAKDSDVTAEALRLSDYTRPLAALKLKAGIVVLDLARANPFARSGSPLAGGLALVDPEPGLLVAFNAAPGTVAPEREGPYGAYAPALAEMIREGGLPLASVFDRARLRVNDATKGAQVPWHASKVETSLVFFERAPEAPPPAASIQQTTALRSQPLGNLAAPEAYAAALDRDTLDGYSEFLTAYRDDPMAARVRAIAAARREALTWQRTRVVDTPPAYWSYLRRYPEGPHAADAHRRLAYLAAAFEPPPSFTAMAYDLPPPPPEEIVYIRRPVLIFDDPVFAFAPPPPPPVIFLAPPPAEFVVLAPPPPPIGIFVLPIPAYRPVPVWVRPPAYVAPPPSNVIYNNVHNTVVINNVTNTVTITNPSGQTQTLPPSVAMAPAGQPAAVGSPQATRIPAASAPASQAPAAATSLAPALPPSVAHKAATLQTQPPQEGGAQSSAPGARQLSPQLGQPLPGMKGQPLPSPPGNPTTLSTPSAAIAPNMPSAAPGSTKPGPAPSQAPASTSAAPRSPSAATTPRPPSSTPGGDAKALAPQTPTAGSPSAAIAPTTPSLAPRNTKPGPTPSQAPAPASSATSTSPSIATVPGTPSSAAGGGAKSLAPQPPNAASPSATITPGALQPSSAGRDKRTPPPSQTPVAKHSPSIPSAAVGSVAPSPGPANSVTPATPSSQPPSAKASVPSAAMTPGTQSPGEDNGKHATQPTGKSAKPSLLTPPFQPVTASPSPPPGGAAKAAAPLPQSPPAGPKPIAPTAAAATPAPPPAAPKLVQPQPKGCPPGKKMAMVNGQPVCK